MNTVQYNTFHWCDIKCSFLFPFPYLEFGEAGISQAGFGSGCFAPARPCCWVFGTAFQWSPSPLSFGGNGSLKWAGVVVITARILFFLLERESVCVCPWLK